MTHALQKLVLAIALTTIVAFWAGLEAGRALGSQAQSGAAPATVIRGSSTAGYSAPPRLCSSSLGPEDYENCKAFFGEE